MTYCMTKICVYLCAPVVKIVSQASGVTHSNIKICVFRASVAIINNITHR